MGIALKGAQTEIPCRRAAYLELKLLKLHAKVEANSHAASKTVKGRLHQTVRTSNFIQQKNLGLGSLLAFFPSEHMQHVPSQTAFNH